MKAQIMALLVAFSTVGPLHATCGYQIKQAQQLQCRPIQLVGPDGGKWTYMDDGLVDQTVLAHILCTCSTQLTTPGEGCEAGRSHRMTFTEETTDILKTCTRPGLCQDACQTLVSKGNR